MAKIINDPVFGELEYNENEGYWKRNISIDIWGVKGYKMDLMVKCGKDEDILVVQKDAYNSFLSRLKIFENDIPNILVSYYKDHYDDIERTWKLDEDLKIDAVDRKAIMRRLGLKSLFIDRNGNYGWLVNLVWKNNPISVILSDDKIRIYEGWKVLVMNYERVEDEVFGDMVLDGFSLKRWVKKDLYGEKGVWVPIVVPGFGEITQEQRNCYLKYLEKEEEFYNEIPNALLTYYLENYKEITSFWDNMSPKYNKENITKESLINLISFHKLYFNEDGERYGWLCGCPWDPVYGLGIFLSGNKIKFGTKDELFD